MERMEKMEKMGKENGVHAMPISMGHGHGSRHDFKSRIGKQGTNTRSIDDLHMRSLRYQTRQARTCEKQLPHSNSTLKGGYNEEGEVELSAISMWCRYGEQGALCRTC